MTLLWNVWLFTGVDRMSQMRTIFKKTFSRSFFFFFLTWYASSIERTLDIRAKFIDIGILAVRLHMPHLVAAIV